MLIGITGGSGCGKSMLSEEFKKAGIPVIDADIIAREVTKPNTPALAEIKKIFGSEYIDSGGSLLRKKLGSFVFANSEALEKLNGIIKRHISEKIREKLENESSGILCLDAPLLIEYGMDKDCDAVIAVLADCDIRIERICRRDGISRKDAENRIKSQNNDKFYLEKADYIVYNNSDREKFKKEAKKIISELVNSIDVLKESETE